MNKINIFLFSFLLLASNVQADYTSTKFEYLPGWRIVFDNGMSFVLGQDGTDLQIDWENLGSYDSALQHENTSKIKKNNYALSEVQGLDDFKQVLLDRQIKDWETRKSGHDQNEAKRYTEEQEKDTEALNDYNEEKAEFIEENKTKKFKKKAPKPLAKKPVPFTEKKPVLNADPAYSYSGLAVLLTGNDCAPGSFILQVAKNNFVFVKTSKESTSYESFFANSGAATKCMVQRQDGGAVQLGLFMQAKKLLQLQIIDRSPAIVTKVVSPKLLEFEDGLVTRAFLPFKALEFSEPFKAEYWESVKSKRVALEISNKKSIINVSLIGAKGLTNPLYDEYESTLKRVTLLSENTVKNEAVLQSRRSFFAPADAKNPNAVLYMADYNHALIGSDLKCQVSKFTGNEMAKDNAYFVGLIYDYSALWYLPSWLASKQKTNLPIAYFDDEKFKSFEINKAGSEMIEFTHADYQDFIDPISVPIEQWQIKNLADGKVFMTIGISREGNLPISVQMESPKRTFTVNKFESAEVTKNLEWAKSFMLNNQLAKIKQ